MRGRKADLIRRERRDTRIREDILAKVDLLLLDPVTQRIAYGAYSRVVEEALERWIADKTGLAPKTVDAYKARLALNLLENASEGDIGNYVHRTTQAKDLLREALGLSSTPAVKETAS